MTAFAELGLISKLTNALAKQGIHDAFAIQQATIEDALAGKDVCGKANTGSGKTLAFCLPLLQRIQDNRTSGPKGLILVPTRELAQQVSDVLVPLAQQVGVRTIALYGGTAIGRQLTRLTQGVDIIVATPGRLIDLCDRRAVSFKNIETVVIDEADRMADMGFLPQVERILRQIEVKHQTVLFSATLDGDVDVLIKRHMHKPVRHEIVSESTGVEEMDHRFLAVHNLDRVKVVASVTRGAARTIIFVRTKRGAERLVLQLRKENVRAEAIHGDLRQSARTNALASFTKGKVNVLVATDVVARGIHVDDIDVVVHYDPPENHKAYIHRSGRTARAGSKGTVVTLVMWNQMREVEALQKQLRFKQPIVEVFSNDPRLADLSTLVEEVPATQARRAAS